MPQRKGPWGTVGSNFFPKIQPLVCEFLTCMACSMAHVLGPLPLGRGQKVKYRFNFNYKVNSKDFLNQILCVFSQMKAI